MIGDTIYDTLESDTRCSLRHILSSKSTTHSCTTHPTHSENVVRTYHAANFSFLFFCKHTNVSFKFNFIPLFLFLELKEIRSLDLRELELVWFLSGRSTVVLPDHTDQGKHFLDPKYKSKNNLEKRLNKKFMLYIFNPIVYIQFCAHKKRVNE